MITQASPEKSGQVWNLPIDSLLPSPENEQLYRPVDPNDPDIIEFARAILREGILVPLLISLDRRIISGHRRHTAARVAGLTEVPCEILSISWEHNRDEFIKKLCECNRQRVKTREEMLREEVISANPDASYAALINHRTRKAETTSATFEIRGHKKRCGISRGKRPMLEAVKQALYGRRKFWPLSVRVVHYVLLNDPPLRHSRKPDSTYRNDKDSYKDLSDLMTRGRLLGDIPWEAISDETRPVMVWNVHQSVQSFFRNELADFMLGYWRDLMQSQPNHIEVVGEKNTIGSIINSVTSKYCIPTTLGRGFSSLPPRHDMAERYFASGKERLVLLVVSDFDPPGENIAHSFAQSMRDDFGIAKIDPIKVALKAEQVKELGLPPGGKVKEPKRNKRFIETYGDNVWELEALQPETLQDILRKAIDSVIDIDAFNYEIDQEKQDSVVVDIVRKKVCNVLSDLSIGDGLSLIRPPR